MENTAEYRIVKNTRRARESPPREAPKPEGEDERRLFSIILLTGMRKGEIEHLTWNDLNFELGVLFIQAKPEVG